MADKIGSKMIVMKYSAFKENFISNDLIQSIDFAFHYNQTEAKKQSQNSKNIEADMKAMVLYFSSFFFFTTDYYSHAKIFREVYNSLVVVKHFR